MLDVGIPYNMLSVVMNAIPKNRPVNDESKIKNLLLDF
jgi:hypothetical protein